MVTFAESTGHVYRRSSPKTFFFLFLFVWNRKRDRISRDTAVKNIADGGLGIRQIKIFMNAVKLIWIRSQQYKP